MTESDAKAKQYFFSSFGGVLAIEFPDDGRQGREVDALYSSDVASRFPEDWNQEGRGGPSEL